jgi:hypothetical protein
MTPALWRMWQEDCQSELVWVSISLSAWASEQDLVLKNQKNFKRIKIKKIKTSQSWELIYINNSKKKTRLKISNVNMLL